MRCDVIGVFRRLDGGWLHANAVRPNLRTSQALFGCFFDA